MSSPNAAFFLDDWSFPIAYGKETSAELSKLTTFYPHRLTKENYREHLDAAQSIRTIFSGWGMQRMDEAFLQIFPKLEFVFYAAGSIRGFMTDVAWDRGIRVTTAHKGNSIPVAEYALSQILFCLKGGWHHVFAFKANLGNREKTDALRAFFPGAYRSTVGLLSLGAIAQMVVKHLKNFDVKIIAYDPVIDPKIAAVLGVKLVSLEELFLTSDVVSCHLPALPATQQVLKRDHFLSMKPKTSFINTGRGSVVDESGLISALRERPDIIAILDVTDPEPLPPDSPLLELPNVIFTPHIAGGLGPEALRFGEMMMDDFRRHLGGQPLQFEITREQAAHMA